MKLSTTTGLRPMLGPPLEQVQTGSSTKPSVMRITYP